MLMRASDRPVSFRVPVSAVSLGNGARPPWRRDDVTASREFAAAYRPVILCAASLRRCCAMGELGFRGACVSSAAIRSLCCRCLFLFYLKWRREGAAVPCCLSLGAAGAAPSSRRQNGAQAQHGVRGGAAPPGLSVGLLHNDVFAGWIGPSASPQQVGWVCRVVGLGLSACRTLCSLAGRRAGSCAFS